MSEHPALPEASFELLVKQFATQAMMQLGDVPNPFSGARDAALPRARLTIGLLEVLQEKTSGNLDAAEHRILEDALLDLHQRLARRSSGGS